MSSHWRKSLAVSLGFLSIAICHSAIANTQVTISGSNFLINGAVTLPKSAMAGMLPNSRMVQAIFDDANPQTVSKWVYPDTKKWDANRNTQEFINAIPSWRKAGLLAVTVNLQGGGPIAGQFGPSQPWINTAFNPDGSLKSAYLTRLDKVIRALDANGMVAIVGLFYTGQEKRISSDAAVVKAVDNIIDWLVAQKYSNVMVEIVNEPSQGHFPDHPILYQATALANLVAHAHQRAAGKLYISATNYKNSALIKSSDYILLHGNSMTPAGVTAAVQYYRKLTNKPIVFNEDSTSIQKFDNAVAAGASWGYYDQGKNNYTDGYQSPPVNWGINTTNKKNFFKEVTKLTTPH